MPALLFLAFLVLPLVELLVILQVGEVVGAGWTIALLVVDSIVGAVIVRREGRRAWQAFREALEAGRWPADEVAQGALVLVGGALLLTPGFVTDGMGLAFVLPPTRALLARVIRSRVKQGAVRIVGFGGSGGGSGTRPRPGPSVGSRGARGTGHRGRESPPEVLDVEVVSVERDRDQTRSDDDRGDGEGA